MSLNLPFGIQPINALSNIDVRYGPWATTGDALTNTAGTRVTGLTVGVIENGGVVEYWFKDGIGDGDLVEKTSGGGSGMLNWSGSTTNAVGTYMSISGICAQPNLTFNGSSLKATGDICASTCVCSPIVCAGTCVNAFNRFVVGGLSAQHANALYQGKIDTTINYGNYINFKDEADTIGFSVANGATGAAFFPLFAGKVTSTNPALYFLGNSVSGPSAGTGLVTFEGRINNAATTDSGITVVNFTSGYGSSRARIMGDCTFCTANVCAVTKIISPALQVTTGAAAGCVLVSDASGNATWQTPAGGGIGWSGSTVNGIGTYVSSGAICAESGLTFDSTTRILTVVPGNGAAPSQGSARLGMVNFAAGSSIESDYLYTGAIVLSQGNSNLGRYALGMSHKSYRQGDGVYTYGHIMVDCLGGLYTKFNANGTDSSAAAAGTWKCHPNIVNGSSDRVLTSNSTNEINGEANLTFNGSLLTATGCICGTTSILSPKLNINQTNYTPDVNIPAHFESTSNCEAVRIYGWTGSTATNYGLRILNKGGTTSGGNYGIFADAYYTAGSSSGRSHGIWALAGGKTSQYNYGVIGQLCGTNGGAAIVGALAGWSTTLPAGCWAGVFVGNTHTCGISCATSCVITPVIQLTTGAATGSVLTSTSTGVGEWCAPIDITTNLVQYDLLCYNGSTITGATDIRLKTGAARCIYFNQAGTTTGSALCIIGNAATGNAAGGAVTIVGGQGGTSTGAGGAVNLFGGSNSVGGASGANICAGNTACGAGGSVTICGSRGCGGTTQTGGNVTISAGLGGNSGGNGGYVRVCGGYTASGTIGCVALFHGVAERLRTTTGGICILGGFLDVAGVTGVGLCVRTGCGQAIDWVATSDCRLKTDIQPISNALSMVTQLCGVCYKMCDDLDENRIGLIAQEVELVLPEIVSHSQPSEDDLKYGITDDKLGLKYDKLTAVLIEAIKEQQKEINELKTEIYYIKNK